MDTSRERDQSIERLLQQSLRTRQQDEVTGSCLDGETLAAWVDGSLPRDVLEAAEGHVADCARCQSLLAAMARTDPAVSQPKPEHARRWWLWLAPLTAAAAAALLWVAVPEKSVAPAVPAVAVTNQTPDANTQPTNTPAPTPARERAAQPPAEELRKGTARLEAESVRRENAAVGALAETVITTAVPVQIVSPDPSVRWRISGAAVERSANAGASWEAVPTGVATALTAGSAPSTMVCWLVGRGGVVLLSRDGRTWQRVPFPEMTDLSSVSAADARTASISTADGRTFSTSDGGVTWSGP